MVRTIAGSFRKGSKPDEYHGVVNLFDKDGKKVKELIRTGEPVWGFQTDPHGEYILCSGEKRVYLFRRDGLMHTVINDVPGELGFVTFLGSRQEILVYYDFGIGRASWCGVHDVSGKFLRRFKLSDYDSPLRLAVSQDGDFIACRFTDAIKVFSAFGTLMHGNLDPGESMESAIRFSPGGKYLGCTGYSTGEVLPITIWKLK